MLCAKSCTLPHCRYGLTEAQIGLAGQQLGEVAATLQRSRQAEAAAALPDSLMGAVLRYLQNTF